MRVLHVVSSASRRGAETFAADLVGLLAEAGVSQRVAILWASPRPGLSYPAPEVPLAPASSAGPLGWVRRVRALRRELGGPAPHVVLAHGGDALEHVVLADPRHRVPVVYRNIGTASPAITRGARRAVYAALMRRPATVIAVADVVARESRDTFGIPPHRLVTIPNGVDIDRLYPARGRAVLRESLGVPDAAPVALSIGALSWEKDPLALVAVAARVLDRRPDGYLLVVGDGPLRGEVESMVASRGLAGRVLLLGSRSDVADLLSAADVLVFASRPGGMEGMPAVLIEAGVAGIPVVSFDVAGVAEVVEHGVTGIVVPPADTEGLGAAVLRLFDDEPVRKELGRRARDRCAERFDLRTQLRDYLEILTRAADRPVGA